MSTAQPRDLRFERRDALIALRDCLLHECGIELLRNVLRTVLVRSFWRRVAVSEFLSERQV
jgi:hypothetical protein